MPHIFGFSFGGSGGGGERGPAGPEGPEGKEGKQGIQGIEGKEGPKGTTGAPGEKGLTGATGPEGKEGKAPEPGAPGEEQTITSLATNTVPAEPTMVYLSLQYKLEATNPTYTLTVDGKTVYKGTLKGPTTVQFALPMTFLVKASGKWIINSGANIEKITAVYQAL
jgi:hypothetical protein